MTIRMMTGALLLLGAAMLTADDALVALVKDGQAKSVLVLEQENLSTRKAGEELQAMLEERTGAKIPLLKAGDPIPEGMIPVYLGLSERTEKLGADGKKLTFDGYYFKATPDYVVIAGRDRPQTDERYCGHVFIICNPKLNYYVFGERGTMNGVCKILERYAGNRYYMPGKLGEVVPKSPDFTLPLTEYTESPAFRERYMYGCWFRDASPDYLHWFYRLCQGGENLSINHSHSRMLKYRDSHPEYFALIDGERDVTGERSMAFKLGNLCLSSPEGIKAFADLACEFFDRNPNYALFPVVPQDGMYRMCECPECQKLYSPHLGLTGKFSNGVFHHVKEIAKIVGEKHPGKLIGTLAYANYRVPPDFDLPSNVAVRICYTRQSLRDPEQKLLVENAIKGFEAKHVPILVWTYPLFNHRPPMRGIPVFYPHILQENMKFNRDHGVIGEFSESSWYSGGADQEVKPSQVGTPGITHLNNYIRCQLLWNPDLDMDAVLEEYYRLFYGPAAAEMKTFWETAEKLFLLRGEATMYTLEDLDTFTEILKSAEAKTDPESVYGQRIRLIRDETEHFFRTMRLIRAKGRFFGVSFVKEDIPLDFDRDGIWKYAMRHTLTMKDGRTNIPKEKATFVYSLANEKGLALHVVAGEPELNKMIERTTFRDDTENAWRDDCLELFLVTADRKENRQYIITVGGQIVDGIRGIDVNVPDWSWTSGLKLKQTRGQGGTQQMGEGVHTTTVFIPWSDLGYTFENLPPLLIQLYRRQTNGDPKDGTYYLLFPSMAFHNYSPEYFGPVKFIAPGNRLENGDFSRLNGKGIPVGWTGAGTAVQDLPDKGKPGWKLSGVKGGNDQGLLSGRIPVDPDTDYILTLRHSGSSLFVYTMFYDADGRRITDPSKQFFWAPCSAEPFTRTFQGRVPAGAAFCTVFLRNFDSSDKSGGASVGSVEFCGGLNFTGSAPQNRP
ncbi:MAG: DUF4838 domain-containing protein [Lentisphaeria bacterium]|nr:DUF4838 domain-containing protein [Lentisphaeria bacterium]